MITYEIAEWVRYTAEYANKLPQTGWDNAPPTPILSRRDGRICAAAVMGRREGRGFAWGTREYFPLTEIGGDGENGGSRRN